MNETERRPKSAGACRVPECDNDVIAGTIRCVDHAAEYLGRIYDSGMEASIERGLADSAAGRVHDLGSFAEFADDTDVTVTQPPTFQGLTLWCGDTLPVQVDDFMAGQDLRDLIRNPVLRAVMVTRLRAVADLLDEPDPEEPR